jgi:hypothetical protein
MNVEMGNEAAQTAASRQVLAQVRTNSILKRG